jgi:hypothetical protein
LLLSYHKPFRQPLEEVLQFFVVFEYLLLDQLLRILKLSQIVLLALEVCRQAFVHRLDAIVNLCFETLPFLLVRLRSRVNVALLDQLVLLVPNKIEPIDVVRKQARSHAQHVARRLLSDSRVGGGHNRDQHVQKHYLNKERCEQEANPNESREVVVSKGTDVEVAQTHEVLVYHSVDQLVTESLHV